MTPANAKNPSQPSADLTTTPHKGGMVWFRNKFLAGLALAAPITVTIWILTIIYNLLHGLSDPLLQFVAAQTNELAGKVVIDIEDPAFKLLARCVAVVIPILALIALGVMATNVIGVKIVEAMDRLLLRIPFLSFIYRSLKQVIEAFKGLGATQNFKRVAYIDYPVPGMRMLAFVTGQFVDGHSGRPMTTVFMPTAPNPMSGLLLVVDSDKVTDAPVTIEEAMKMIFSAGLVAPESQGRVVHPGDTLPVETSPALDDLDLVDELEDSEMFLPAGLPRAEDFDSGDNELLASTFEVDSIGGSGKRWLKVPWRRR